MKKYKLGFTADWIAEKIDQFAEESNNDPQLIIMHPEDYSNLWTDIKIDSLEIYRSEDVKRYEIMIL